MSLFLSPSSQPAFRRLRRMGAVWLFQVLGFSSLLQASRVKDLTLVSGGRENQLVGYGLVIGLAGDGDSNAQGTLRSVANTLQRFGITIDPTQIKAKNVAAVMVTTDIGPFLRNGARIDVTVA